MSTLDLRHLLARLFLFAGLAFASGCSTITGPFFNKSQELDTQPLESVACLARLSERHGKPDDASRLYRYILNKEPNHQTAHHRLGVIAAKEANFEQAESHF